MSVSIVMIRGILWELRSRRLDPAPLLAECKLSEDMIADIRTAVSSETYHTFVRRALDVTGDPALGLSMGSRAPENMLQIVGHLMLASTTLRDAIALFRRYSLLFAAGVQWELSERNEVATFSYMPGYQLGDTTRFTNEYVMATANRIGRHFALRPESHAVEVRFQHPAPAYASRYEATFGCPVRFSQSANSIVFNASTLDMRQLHADETVRAMLGDTAERLLREREGSTTVDRVRTVLRYRRDLSNIDSNTLAAAVGLTPRALRRRLGAEGASLTALLDEARLRLACEDLKRPDSSIKEISDRLGFSEPSAFHRAFKRWTGLTPSQFGKTGS
jgi:AraC-like DNA-binding protein